MRWEELVGHIAGRVAQGMRPDDPVARMYAAALAKLGEHALTRWATISAAGVRCAVQVRHRGTGAKRLCGIAAAGSCTVCQAAVCIEHALASVRDGELLCDGCVVAMRRMYAGVAAAHGEPERVAPRSREREGGGERATYLRRLGLDDSAGPEDIKRAFRQLAKKYHPDTKPAGKARERAERRFKEINEAYQWLMRQEAA
jgi:hypothetical protein